MNENFNKEVLKYALGILIFLAFIAILGIYVFFLSRSGFLGGNQNGAGVLLSSPVTDDVNTRLANVQNEINDTLARMQAMQAANVPKVVSGGSSSAAPVQNFLKISNFSASQTSISSGSQVTFSYNAVNTEGGQAFRLLLQCPTGVSAMYQNGTNVCRSGIGQALPIDNSGNYTVTLTNNSADAHVVIAVLLASDMTDNNIFFRDSKVLTVTILPSGNYNPITDTNTPVVLSVSPNGGTVPVTIGFTATLNNLTTCLQSNWNFGDGISSGNFAVCPNSNSGIKTQVLQESHTYNQPGTYTAILTSGGRTVSSTVYVSAATSVFNTQPIYSPTYSYIPQLASVYYTLPSQIYSYFQPQQPIYPSLPDVPTTPLNLRAVASGANSIALGWSAPTYGNVYSYILYRQSGDSLSTPINISSVCTGNSVNSCYYTVAGGATNFTDLNVLAGSNYTYRIVATNQYGNSNPSDSLTVSLSQSNSPTVPRTFTASPNHGTIALNWTSPLSGNVSNYTIYRRGGSSLGVPISASPSACTTGTLNSCYYFVSGQTTTLADSSLFPNTDYTYRIIAANPFGASEFSDSLTVNSGQPLPPVSTPNMNSASRRDEVSATLLSWNSVGASYYKVFRGTSRNVAPDIDEGTISLCTRDTTIGCFVDGGYSDGQIYSLQIMDNQYDSSKTYYYKVRAYSGNGASDWSNEITASPSSITNTTPPVTSIVNFASNPVLPHVIPEGVTWVICQTTNSVSQSRIRAYTTDTLGRDRRSCVTSWTDSVSGIYRYRYGCYGSTDRSTVDGSLLMGNPRSFVCEEVDALGNPLVPTNSRSIVKNCSAGDVTTPGQEIMCNGTGALASADPLITSFTIDGQTSPTVAAGASVNLIYSGTNVSTYRLFLQCPVGVVVSDPVSGSNLCRSSSNDAFPISSTGSYRITLNNQATSVGQLTATLQALRANGSVSHTLSRVINVSVQTVITPPPSTHAAQIDPTRVTVNAGQTTVNLSWTRSDTITTSYDVYRTSDPNAAWNASTYVGSTVGSNYSGIVNDTGLTPNTTYYYYIFSVAGYSGPNNSAPVKISATTQVATVVTPDPVITSFLITGQTAPTVNSGAQVGFTFTGTNVASYKILLQCPANVAIPDTGGNNLCRTGESDAIPFPASSSIQIAIFNMTSGNQLVNATLYALRTDGSTSNSLTRTITVRPQPGF